jgi:hypothetical protein
VSAFEIVPNPAKREYLVVWRARYRPEPESDSLYARRFDASNGEPKSDPVRLFGRLHGSVLFVTTFEPESQHYVVASQGAADGPLQTQPPVEVRRFSLNLTPSMRTRRLGAWQLADLVAEPSGHVAVVGLERNQIWGPSLARRARPVELRVQTLDASGKSVAVAHRSAGRGAHVSLAARAAFDAVGGRVLVAWQPSAQPVEGGRFRLETIPAPPAGSAAAPPAGTGHPTEGLGFACNPRRHDCLVVYPGRRVAGLLDLRGQLFDLQKQRSARPFPIASGSRGAIGASASGAGYALSWYTGAIQGSTIMTVIDAELTPPKTLKRTDRYELPGEAAIGSEPSSGTRLTISSVPREHNSTEIVGRLQR